MDDDAPWGMGSMYDLTSAPGVFATLADEEGHTIVLAEWPRSLLDLYRLRLLAGRAKEMAAALQDPAQAHPVSPPRGEQRNSVWAI